MKLSLMIPTHNSAETIERTLASALAQTHRPLEVVVYDEVSRDSTRDRVRALLATAAADIETRFLTSEENSGAVYAWRVLLHDATGAWCAFVWADDVLAPTYSTLMMAGAARAQAAGRTLVSCSAFVEKDGQTVPYYSADKGLATEVEFSEGIFLRRFPLTQICAVYEAEAARRIFDHHIRIQNPLGFDYNRHPYGNDVGFLSELAAEGGGVELLGDRLVTLVDSGTSMTRQGSREHLWQMRWQYTFNQLRVWTWWAERGLPGAQRVRALAQHRLALCSLMLGAKDARWRPPLYLQAVLGYLEFRRLDYQRKGWSLDEYRRLTSARSTP